MLIKKVYSIVLIFFIPFFQNTINGQETQLELKKVVIDPGHGGKDPGATVGNIREKDIVLDVSLLLGQIIKNQYPDIEVIYTRNTDTFVPLSERADIANKSKADLFISIHCNSFHSDKISGAETFILGNHRTEENLKIAQKENSVILLEDDYTSRYEGFDPNSAESYIMFSLIQDEFLEQSRQFADHLQQSFVKSAMRHDRGVKQAGFLVLRRTTMPSVLVELGFISNKADQSFLLSNKGKTKMASSIANAFISYKTKVDEKSGAKLNTQKPAAPLANKQNPKTKQKILPEILQLNSQLSSDTCFAIQVLASKTALDKTNNALKDNLPVFEHYNEGWYRYYKNISTNLDDSYKNQDSLKTIFDGAFLVRFINKKRDKVIRY